MDHVQAVQSRIAAIRGLVESARPDAPAGGGFRAALESALGTGATPPPTGTAKAAAASPGMPLAAFGPPAAPRGGARVLPVRAPVSSEFGPRLHPISGSHQHHSGVDFAAPAGTPVQAAASGRVVFAGSRGGYGNLVIVRHADGAESWYAHQRDIAVRVGQDVTAGEALGTVGSTGRSTGPHLHLELRRGGVAVDPLPWLGAAVSAAPAHGHR